MKKKLISLILTIAVVTSFFSGCQLITTNSKRDMAQVVATVSTTGSDITYKDNIYKRDLVSYFNSVGYYYVQQGRTYKETYEALLNQLVNSKIFIHQSKRYFIGLNSELSASSPLSSFLEEWENAKAEYLVNLSVNSLLDNFELDIINEQKLNATPKEDYLENPGYNEENKRTVVSTADNEIEITKDNYTDSDIVNHYKLYIKTPSTVIGSTLQTRVKAYRKMVQAIDYYNLLGNPGFDEFKNSDFYKDELKRQQESILISKYTESIKSQVSIEGMDDADDFAISYAQIKENYNKKFLAEKEKYTKNITEYKSALDELKEDDYILFHPEGKKTYGYVHNILIPFSTEQLSAIARIPYDQNSSAYQAEINRLIKGSSPYSIDVTGSEQRASWVVADYKTKTIDGKVYFEDKLYAGKIDENYKGIAFNGTISEQTGTNKQGQTVLAVTSDGKKVYDIEPAKDIAFNTIYEDFVSLIGGATYSQNDRLTQYNDFFVEGNSMLYLGKSNAAEADLEQIANRVRDFSLAYSTDTGALGLPYGYAVPNDSFVKSFSTAAEEVIKLGEGGFSVVVSNYGLHIIYCSKVITPTDKDATESPTHFIPQTFEEFKLAINDKDSFTYKFAFTYLDTLRTSYWSTHEESVIEQYNNETNVTKYEKRYKDLFLD